MGNHAVHSKGQIEVKDLTDIKKKCILTNLVACYVYHLVGMVSASIVYSYHKHNTERHSQWMRSSAKINHSFYRPHTEYDEGNAFTSVCLSRGERVCIEGTDHPPPHPQIQSTGRQYASYWNAILFLEIFTKDALPQELLLNIIYISHFNNVIVCPSHWCDVGIFLRNIPRDLSSISTDLTGYWSSLPVLWWKYLFHYSFNNSKRNEFHQMQWNKCEGIVVSNLVLNDLFDFVTPITWQEVVYVARFLWTICSIILSENAISSAKGCDHLQSYYYPYLLN